MIMYQMSVLYAVQHELVQRKVLAVAAPHLEGEFGSRGIQTYVHIGVAVKPRRVGEHLCIAYRAAAR